MIFSDKHRYLFIETPHTGSTAISAELRELYAGESILKKHSSFYDFRAHVGRDAENFFIFAAVRNPIDEAASVFLKLKYNHKGNYTNQDKALGRGGWVSARQRRAFQDVLRHGSFNRFLLHFYKLPFTSAINVNRSFCDRILRFETLQTDFSSTLKSLGIEAKRPLPVLNSTANTDEKEQLVSAVEQTLYNATFGAFMQEWGYRLPNGDAPQVSFRGRFSYESAKLARTALARYERVLPDYAVRAARNFAG